MAAVDTSARTMLNDHGRALCQFLALVRRLDRRRPGLTLSSERGHGSDLRMERWRNKVATQPKRDKAAARNQLQSSNLAANGKCTGGWGRTRTRDLKEAPPLQSQPHCLSEGSGRGTENRIKPPCTAEGTSTLYPLEKHNGWRWRGLESLSAGGFLYPYLLPRDPQTNSK